MKNNPTISIIVPVYNVEKYISACIESLKNQTFGDFEAIIIDDGSPDNSIKIAKEIAGNDERFIFLTKKNGGVSSARNLGLKYVRGKYIGFLDSDDYFKNTFLEKMIDGIKDADMCICGIYNQSEDGKKYIPASPPYEGSKNTEEIFPYFLGGNSGYVWNKLFKKKCFDNIIFPEGRKFEDHAIMYKLIYMAKKIIFIPDILYYYSYNKGGITKKYDFGKIEDMKIIFEEMIDFLLKENIYEKYKKQYVLAYLQLGYFGNILLIIWNSQNKLHDLKKIKIILDSDILSFRNISYTLKIEKRMFLIFILFKIHPALLLSVYKIAKMVKLAG